MGFDPICVTTKKVLRKLGGDKISGKAYTFDGNNDGKEIFKQQGIEFVRIGEPIDLNKIMKVSVIYNGVPMDLSAKDIEVMDVGPIATAGFDGITGILCLRDGHGYADVSNGTYVVSIPSETAPTYVSRIVLRDTIVPIDQKYLPGVCLPVVELSQETMTAIFTSGSATATEEEASAIISAKNAIVPIVVMGDFNGMVFAITANLSSDGISAGYTADFGGMKLYFEVSDTSVSISTLA